MVPSVPLPYAGDPVEEVVTKIHTFLRQTADDMENNRLAVGAARPLRPLLH